MRILLLLYFLSGCTTQKLPQPSDTVFKPENRNWLLIYELELEAALKNDDTEAFYIFWPEYIKELDKQKQNSVDNINEL